jgi:acyl-coenzyme A synthetase/AMP-(fatty) acid ligase
VSKARESRIRLWKGYHSPELLGFVRAAIRPEASRGSRDDLLILCPPLADDLSFIPFLPMGEIELVGDAWSELDRTQARMLSEKARAGDYPAVPVLGVFTSGTVGGKPRLVLYSMANIEASLGAILEVFDRERIDSIFCYPQPFHTFGLILGYVQAIATGRLLIAPNGRYSADFHRAWRVAAADHSGMLTLGTPTHFQDLLKASQSWGAEKIPPTYTAIIGGAAVPRTLWLALRDRMRIAAPSIGYGCTEASPGLTHLPPGHEPTDDGEIGGILRGIKLEILPGTGLEFTGPQACLAIIQNGRLDFPKKILIRDRLARLTEARLVFEGRYDLVFNRGGMKFSLEEIERHLRETFPTSEFLGVAVHDERLGEELGLLVRAGDPPTETFRQAIAGALHTKFHAHFNPGHILWVTELPTNAAAKPDRGTGSRLVGALPAELVHSPR